MFVWTVCMLSLVSVSSACDVQDVICTNLTSVQEEITNVHNMFRRDVSPPASNMLKMNWSKEVAKSAQAWADTCTMRHGPPSTRMIGGYEMGENLLKSTSLVKWTNVVTAWYNEDKNYIFPSGSSNGNSIGHYTQVVWYSSYEVGCGVAKCNDGEYFYACHYYRAGNFKGVAPYTQGESCSACPQACEDKLCTDPCPYIDIFRNCPSTNQQEECNNYFVRRFCPAICQCAGKIIPVGKK